MLIFYYGNLFKSIAISFLKIAARPLFTIAEVEKPPKYPSTDEWIEKICYVYTKEYYSAIRRNEIMPFATEGRT